MLAIVKMELSEVQTQIIQILPDIHNVFVTGLANIACQTLTSFF